MWQDNIRHQGARYLMIKKLKQQGIEDAEVLKVMNLIPRHLFMEKCFEHVAYENRAFAISCGQTISDPYMVAYQTSLLKIQKNDKILEIGTGSGYQAAILCALNANVYSIERHLLLFEKAKKNLYNLGYKPILKYGDGYKGLDIHAPFDKIIVTAAAPNIPELLVSQLKIGGILIIPIGKEESSQCLYQLIKTSTTEIELKVLESCSFVPMLENIT